MKIDFVDVPKEVREETLDSPIFTDLNEVHTETRHSRHNKPKKANIKVIPEGT